MHYHPSLNVPSALTSGEKAVRVQAKEHRNPPPGPRCALQPPSIALSALRDTVVSYRSTVPEPVLSGCHLLHPSFHREAVKQLQFIMSCAVAGQTTHRKAWFAGTKLLSKLEAFPEKFSVQDEDRHNLVTVTGTNSAKKKVHICDIQSTATTHTTAHSSLQSPELHPCTKTLHMELRVGNTPGPHSAQHSPLSLSRDRFFFCVHNPKGRADAKIKLPRLCSKANRSI